MQGFNVKFHIRLLLVIVLYLFSIYLLISITSCSHKRPKDLNNICSIFNEKKRWYKYVEKSKNKWGTPIPIQMAILQQESGFRYDAKPQRKKLLGFIPWKRESSAYGYAQVLTETWKEYRKDTKNRGADRDKFKDAIDFVGWYTYNTQLQVNVSKWDAYNQYLAYHEGRGGFKKKSYEGKQWLIQVAEKVARNAKKFSTQLKACNL